MSKHNIIDIISKKSPHLNWIDDGLMLLVRHGSRAYGTHTPQSDEDFKGVFIPPSKYYLGFLHRIEQIELKAPDPDTVIFEIRKIFNLMSVCNPNAIEMLFVDPSDQLYVSDIGQKLIDNRELFLSKKIKHTMTGYAISQLKRVKLHKQHLLNPPKAPPTRADLGLPEQTLIPQDQLTAAFAEVQKELDRMRFDFMDNLDEPTKIEIRNSMATMLAEMKLYSDSQFTSAAKKIGLDDNFIQVMQKERQYASAKMAWDQYQNWRKTRNPERAKLEEKFGYDCKHAYHLVRLIRMCKEVLTTGKVNVKRPDKDELLAIRNGAWTYDQLLEYADSEEKNINELYSSTSILPNEPDKEKLDKLCIELISEFYNK